MKTIIISVIILLSSCNQKKSTEFKEKKAVPIFKVKLEYVDFDIETCIDVSCDDFSVYFGEINSKELIEINDLRQFWNIFSETSETNTKYDGNIDVRGKALVYFLDGHIEDYCIGTFATKCNNKIVPNSERMMNY